MKRKRTAGVSVYIPNNKKDRDYVRRLERLAEQDERSVSFIILAAIDEYLAMREGDKENMQ